MEKFSIGDFVVCKIYGVGFVLDVKEKNKYPLCVHFYGDMKIRRYRADGTLFDGGGLFLLRVN
jgi:hypothetical protein